MSTEMILFWTAMAHWLGTAFLVTVILMADEGEPGFRKIHSWSIQARKRMMHAISYTVFGGFAIIVALLVVKIFSS